MHERRHQSRCPRAGENVETGPARRTCRTRGEQITSREVERGDPIRKEVVVAHDPIGCRAEVARRGCLVPLPVGEDHDDEWLLRRSGLETGLPPKVRECIVEALEKCSAPLGVGSRRVEADDVVPRGDVIETRGERAQDPFRQLPGRRRLGLGRERLPPCDRGSRHEFESLVDMFEQESAIQRLHDHPGLDVPRAGIPLDPHPFPGRRRGHGHAQGERESGEAHAMDSDLTC